jgi:hydrogenase-4 component E
MDKFSGTSTAGVLLDVCGALILLCCFACLGSKLFNRYLAYYGAQSIVLSVATAVVAWRYLKRDVALSTGLSTSIIVGGVLTVYAYLVTRPQDLPAGLTASAVVPMSTAVILLGALTMVLRRHTVAQLIGWLILENGVFLGAITLAATFPFIVEAGIFLDLVAGVLIMLVFVSGMTHQLAHATADELRGLRG